MTAKEIKIEAIQRCVENNTWEVCLSKDGTPFIVPSRVLHNGNVVWEGFYQDALDRYYKLLVDSYRKQSEITLEFERMLESFK